MESDHERRIRERAYEIWVREGRPHGRDAEHWRAAEAEIASEESAEVGAAANRSAGGSRSGTETSMAETPIKETAPVRSRRAPPRPGRGTGTQRGGT